MTPPKTSLGLAIFTFTHRLRQNPAIADPLKLLELARELGAGGIQTSLAGLDEARGAELRRKAENDGMWIEGSESLPKRKEDVDRFDAALRGVKAAGATTFRTVLLGGRRYEAFDGEAAWERFQADARRWLELAEPSLARHGLTAAFENHKDFRVSELLPFLQRLGSERVAVCVDFANNFTLMEDNAEVVEALAPVSAGGHVKDMALGAYADGFLAADVPLGQGVHDLPRMIGALRKARPGARLCLEMSTRDPLKVPVFTEKYWATLKGVSGADFARALKLVRERGVAREKLPAVDALPLDERVKLEEEAVRVSLAYAADVLKC
ncbi:MAG TPA: TIM barrel protein [Planctomycetota bacterium]